jgi:hypothetical protein
METNSVFVSDQLKLPNEQLFISVSYQKNLQRTHLILNFRNPPSLGMEELGPNRLVEDFSHKSKLKGKIPSFLEQTVTCFLPNDPIEAHIMHHAVVELKK